MTDVLMDTQVKLAQSTYATGYKSVSISSGKNYKVKGLDQYTGVIIYYTLISNNYLKTFFIHQNTYGTWYHDTHTQGTLYVRVAESEIQLSTLTSGSARVLGYVLVY